MSMVFVNFLMQELMQINVMDGQKKDIPIGELENSPMGKIIEVTGFEPAASTSRT